MYELIAVTVFMCVLSVLMVYLLIQDVYITYQFARDKLPETRFNSVKYAIETTLKDIKKDKIWVWLLMVKTGSIYTTIYLVRQLFN